MPANFEEVTLVTYVVWIAIALAAVVFCIFAGRPLYNTYKTRGQGADVAEGQAYFKAKARAEAKAGAGQRLGRAGPAAPGRSGPPAGDAGGPGVPPPRSRRPVMT